MCGIVGMYSEKNEISQLTLQNSLNSILHRGPDGQGIYLNSSKNVALGHVRLAIMDPAGGHQPLFNENKSIALVANGEFYDFEKIRSELTKKGHHFKTKSDSEIAIHLYKESGIHCLKDLRGEFAFILFDQNKNELIAVRDRFGIKPLYYSTYNDQIYIASEIKALFAAGVIPQWSEENMYQALHFSSLEGSTLYKNIFQVPPGYYLHLKNNKLNLHQYWDQNYPKKSKLAFKSEDDVIKTVKSQMEEAIHLRTRSDVPIACYLSGGVDSSTVLGMSNRLTGKKIPAFTIAFDHQDFDETKLAQKMCEFTGSPFFPIKVTNLDFADVFSSAVEKSDMPYFNGHAPARFILSREVKKAGFKVVLGGEGADELFAGYHFSQAALSGSVENKTTIATLLKRLITTPSDEVRKIKNISKTLFWGAKVLGFPPELAKNLIQQYDHLQSFLDPKFINSHHQSDPFKKFLTQFSIIDNISRAPFHVVLYLWMKSHFPQYVLGAERLDMAHAVELRLPFLDHHLFELTKYLPASLLYKNNLNKYLLRTIAKNDVCPEVLNKMKQPFIAPPSTLGNTNPLFTLVCDLLQSQDFKNIPFFNHTHITELLNKIIQMDDQKRAPYDPIFYFLASLAVLNRKYKIS